MNCNVKTAIRSRLKQDNKRLYKKKKKRICISAICTILGWLQYKLIYQDFIDYLNRQTSDQNMIHKMKKKNRKHYSNTDFSNSFKITSLQLIQQRYYIDLLQHLQRYIFEQTLNEILKNICSFLQIPIHFLTNHISMTIEYQS